MRITPLIQGVGERCHADLLNDCLERVKPDTILFAFAYVSMSGVAALNDYLLDHSYTSANKKFLVGIDYGRSDPKAMRALAGLNLAEVRVVNGASVLNKPNLIPDKDYHMKVCIGLRENDFTSFMLVGSGNLSRKGLVESYEAGAFGFTETRKQYEEFSQNPVDELFGIWNEAASLRDVIEPYERIWAQDVIGVEPGLDFGEAELDSVQAIWIDPGYVTKNRGPNRPGNQIDAPRGFHQFFGLQEKQHQPRNSVIGDITFDLPSGETLERRLRLGNNWMEKITLPIPEQVGFGAYDGKIIEFRKVQGRIAVLTFEVEEYFRVFARSRSFRVFQMGSGRIYGVR